MIFTMIPEHTEGNDGFKGWENALNMDREMTSVAAYRDGEELHPFQG